MAHSVLAELVLVPLDRRQHLTYTDREGFRNWKRSKPNAHNMIFYMRGLRTSAVTPNTPNRSQSLTFKYRQRNIGASSSAKLLKKFSPIYKNTVKWRLGEFYWGCRAQWSIYVPPIGHYMYRTVVTICTAQWSLYVPHSGHYMYRTVVTICTAQWSLYVPPV